MLDFADMVVLNKSEKRGSADALRDVRKQWRRNHPDRMSLADADVPVFPTIASRLNDPGVNRLFAAICKAVNWPVSDVGPTELTTRDPLIPASRVRYLAEIAQSGRAAAERIEQQAAAAERAHAFYESLKALKDAALPAPLDRYPESATFEVGVGGTSRASTPPARAPTCAGTTSPLPCSRSRGSPGSASCCPARRCSSVRARPSKERSRSAAPNWR